MNLQDTESHAISSCYEKIKSNKRASHFPLFNSLLASEMLFFFFFFLTQVSAALS